MDTSNPVVSGERVKCKQFKTEQILLKRQNFKHLEDIIKKGERKNAPFLGVERQEVDVKVVKHLATSSIVKVEKGNLDLSFLHEAGKVIISKWHEQGVRQKGPHVSVARTFPQYKRDEVFLDSLLKYLPDCVEHVEKVVYTGGTKSGFSKRLQMWVNQRKVSARKMCADWALDPFKVLNKRMPVDDLPAEFDWHRKVDDLLDEIDINRTSSAGPPFYTQKWKCFDQVLELIGEVVKAANQDNLEQFLEVNKEILLAEVKNKEDRYKVEQVGDKTRPYFSFCSSLSLLISILCQPFCRALFTFTEHLDSANAYGFSWAHGGAEKLYNWMSSTENGKRKFCAYGDDVKIVWRDKEGKLFHVNPDFKHMDASIDLATVDITVTWVKQKFEDQFGKNEFFGSLCDVWKLLAISGPIIVEGSSVFEPDQGLRTGVIGTTLFDTVKSVLAVAALFQSKIDLKDVGKVEGFFRDYGLIVKEGTYEVEQILEDNRTPFQQEFLGCIVTSVVGKNFDEYVPYISEEKLVSLIGNLRQLGGRETSLMQEQRRRFDQARGYMITSAFHHPRVWDALCDVIEKTPPLPICMRIQTNNGTGERPENFNIVEEDFMWPSSDGVPTVQFCKNVFLTRDNKIDGDDLWIDLFPTLKVQLSEFKRVREHVEAVPVPTNSKDWNVISVAEEINERVENIRDPAYPVEVQEAPLGKFRFPKGFIKFVDRPVVGREDKINNMLVDVSEIHHQALELMLFQYGGYFIAQHMMKEGWFPTSDGYWVKDESRKAKMISCVWSSTQRRALQEHYLSITPESSVEANVDMSGVPKMYIKTFSEQFEDVRTHNRNKWPTVQMDSVSFVSTVFIMFGTRLEVRTEVLAQTPNNRVRVLVYRMDNGKVVGDGVMASAKEAKKAIYSQIASDLRVT